MPVLRYDDYDDYDDVKAEFAAEKRAKRRYANRLAAHPDPRDPDWPGHDEPSDDCDSRGSDDCEDEEE